MFTFIRKKIEKMTKKKLILAIILFTTLTLVGIWFAFICLFVSRGLFSEPKPIYLNSSSFSTLNDKVFYLDKWWGVHINSPIEDISYRLSSQAIFQSYPDRDFKIAIKVNPKYIDIRANCKLTPFFLMR